MHYKRRGIIFFCTIFVIFFLFSCGSYKIAVTMGNENHQKIDATISSKDSVKLSIGFIKGQGNTQEIIETTE